MAEKDNRARLSIYSLDYFKVFRAQTCINSAKWQRKKVALLFKYLLIAEAPVPRHVLINEFWPRVEFKKQRARHNLAVTLYDLRRTLCPCHPSTSAPSYILSTNDYLELNWNTIDFYDVKEFERYYSLGQEAMAQQQWERAETTFTAANKLYRTDFLVADTGYCWITEERTRLQNMRLELFEDLAMAQYKLGHYRQAQLQAETLIQLNPCREQGYRLLMRILTALGRRVQAIEKYRECERMLKTEFGLKPDPKTTELYQSIMSGKSH